MFSLSDFESPFNSKYYFTAEPKLAVTRSLIVTLEILAAFLMSLKLKLLLVEINFLPVNFLTPSCNGFFKAFRLRELKKIFGM